MFEDGRRKRRGMMGRRQMFGNDGQSRTLLRIQLPDVSRLELLLAQLCLLLHAPLIPLRQADEPLQPLFVALPLAAEVVHLQRLGPDLLVQVHQHVLFQPGFPVVDANAVVMPVEAVDQRLDGGFVQVSEVRRRLPRLVAHHQGLWVDEPEGVDDHFAFDGLDGVHDDGDGAGGQLLEGLLRVDVDGGEPAAEARVRVVPADDGFVSGMRRHVSRAGFVVRSICSPYLPVCRSMSIIRVWKTGSTASTLTPVPLCGMAKTSTTRTV